jgi:antitoxin ParD1/3/4
MVKGGPSKEEPSRTTRMNVSLTPELEKFVNDEVRSGRYKSASEVVREGLRLIRPREAKIKQLRRDIQEGIDELDRGEGIPAEKVFTEMRRKAKPMLKPKR